MVAALAATTLGVAGVASLAVGLSDPSAFFGSAGAGISQMLGGAPTATPWSGATAEEVAEAAARHLLVPLVAAIAVEAALHGLARSKTRAQATLGTWPPLVFALLGTVLAVSAVSSGAYFKRVDAELAAEDVLFFRGPFETASQRRELNRRYDGYLRIQSGAMSDPTVAVAGPRTTVREPRFLLDGAPADIALQTQDGVVTRFLVRDQTAALSDVPLARLEDLRVQGRTTPRGTQLLLEAFAFAWGPGATAPLLVSLLLLLGASLASWGFACAASWPFGRPSRAVRVALSLLPSAGLTLGSAAGSQLVETASLTAALGAGLLAAALVALRAREAR